MGIDAGATLSKLAIGRGDHVDYETIPSARLADVVDAIAKHRPATIGLTGCGAKAIQARIPEHGGPEAGRFPEFDAWGAGAHAQLGDPGAEAFDETAPYLLISLGTGTSVMRVADGAVTRVGGTALGGGTVLGLGVAMTGCESFEQPFPMLDEYKESPECLRVCVF